MLHHYRNRLAIIFLLIVIAFISIFKANISTTSATDKEKRSNEQESKEKDRGEDESKFLEDVIGREEWFYKQRAFPLDTIPHGAREKALKYVRENMRKQRGINPNISGNAWIPFGPDSIPNGQVLPNDT